MMRPALLTAALFAAGFSSSAFATVTAVDVSTSPGAANVVTPITYTARAGIAGAEFRATLNDTNNIVAASADFQIFNTCPDDGLGGCLPAAWQSCSTDPANVAVIQSPLVSGSCTQTGEAATYSISRAGVVMGNVAAGMRVVYNIEAGATDGQTATIEFGPYCTGIETAGTTGCSAIFDTSGTRVDAPDPSPVTVAGTIEVLVSADRALSFAPNFGTTITFPAGATPGSAAPAQTITVTASGNQGTATLTGCTTAAPFSVTPSSLTFNDATPGPFDLSVGCSYPTANATGTLTCTQTDQGGAPTQRTWDLSCPAPNAAPTVTVSPADGSPIAVGSAAPNEFGTAGITFTATGGSGNSPFSINCSSTGAVQLALGGAAFTGQTANQALTGAQAPQQVRVGVQLTNNAQPAAGTVSCDITDAGGPRTVTYNVSAGAGISVPLFVPASSLWSQLALIALFLGLGGVVLVLRRNG